MRGIGPAGIGAAGKVAAGARVNTFALTHHRPRAGNATQDAPIPDLAQDYQGRLILAEDVT